MKHLSFIIFSLICFFAHSQEVISETQSIEIQEDTLVFLRSVRITDNGTNYPDTAVTRNFLGDSIAAQIYLRNIAVEEQQFVAARMAVALEARARRSSFNSIDDLYSQIDSISLYERLENDYYPFFQGRYRINDIAADTSWTAVLVRVGAANRYRLEHEGTGERLAFLPRSRNNFQVNNLGGENVEFWFDRIPRNNGNKVYKSAAFIENNHKYIITKIN
jgi:hypothetical protein